jgi:pimeloyl-ACP methyl ester carboxylesterase
MSLMPNLPRQVQLSRRARRAIAYGLGIGMAAPRTLQFAAETLMHRNGNGDSAHLSPALLAQVAMDELVLAAMKTPGKFPHRSDYEAAGADVLATYELFHSKGWDTDASTYHLEPQAPEHVVVEPAWWMGEGWEHAWFDSGFTPATEDPSRARWLANEPNRVMRAWIKRVGDGSGPWVVCVHPFGTGQSMLGSFIFKANALSEQLGVNIALVVLPLHGSRGGGWIAGGSAFMTYNPIDVLLGLTQSVWDVRRFNAWIRSKGGGPIALYGVSLGAHVSATVAGLDPDLAGVVAGVPTVDLLEVFIRHVPKRLHPRAIEHHLIGPESRAVVSVTSPLAFPPLVGSDRLFIFAGTGDRMSPPEQARALWRHWGEPEIAWFDTNHMAFIWNASITAFVRESLRRTLDLPSAA